MFSFILFMIIVFKMICAVYCMHWHWAIIVDRDCMHGCTTGHTTTKYAESLGVENPDCKMVKLHLLAKFVQFCSCHCIGTVARPIWVMFSSCCHYNLDVTFTEIAAQLLPLSRKNYFYLQTALILFCKLCSECNKVDWNYIRWVIVTIKKAI